MWRVSEPIGQRVDIFGSYIVQVTDWATRHRYMAVGAILVISLLAGGVVAIAAHMNQQTSYIGANGGPTSAMSAQVDRQVPTVDGMAPSLSSSTTPSGESFNSNVEVEVNGQSIPVPQNGSFSRTIPNDASNNGGSNIHVSVSGNTSSTSSGSSSSISVQSNSSSSTSEVSVQNSE